jgi:hypothetical protein
LVQAVEIFRIDKFPGLMTIATHPSESCSFFPAALCRPGSGQGIKNAKPDDNQATKNDLVLAHQLRIWTPWIIPNALLTS